MLCLTHVNCTGRIMWLETEESKCFVSIDYNTHRHTKMSSCSTVTDTWLGCNCPHNWN